MNSAAWSRVERARKRFQPVSKPQRRTLASLARQAGIERPHVRTKDEASDALDRLKAFLTQPQLEGFSAATKPESPMKEGAR